MRIRVPMAMYGGLALITAAIALPQISKAEYSIIGIGNNSCGYWTEQHAKDNTLAHVLDQWLGGYFSGFDAATIVLAEEREWAGNISRGTDFSGLKAWVSNYCMDNPLDKIFKAAVSLVVDLVKRQDQ